MTFQNPGDFDLVQEDDKVDILGLSDLTPDKPVQVTLKHADGSEDTITCDQSLTEDQIKWFKYGSALNLLNSK